MAILTSDGRPEGVAIRSALEGLLVEYGIFEDERDAEQSGSWWQRLKFKTQQVIQTETFKAHLAEAEYRLQIELVEKAAAEVNKTKTDAACALIAAVDKSKQAVVIFGQTVIVKFNGTIIVLTGIHVSGPVFSFFSSMTCGDVDQQSGSRSRNFGTG